MGSGVSTTNTYDIDDPRDVSLQLVSIISEEYQLEFIRTSTTLKKLISYNNDELNDLIDSIHSGVKINIINKINTLKDNNANRFSGSIINNYDDIIEALDRSCADDDVELIIKAFESIISYCSIKKENQIQFGDDNIAINRFINAMNHFRKNVDDVVPKACDVCIYLCSFKGNIIEHIDSTNTDNDNNNSSNHDGTPVTTKNTNPCQEKLGDTIDYFTELLKNDGMRIPSLCVKILNTLIHIIILPSNNDKAGNGLCQAIVEVLRVHDKDISIVCSGFTCISYLIEVSSSSNRNVLRNSDIADTAFNILTKYSQIKSKKYNSDVCASVTRAISSIARIAKGHLGQIGCCELLVELLKTCTNEEVASGCIQAIAHISLSEQSNQKKLSSSDACEAIVKTINMYPTNSTIGEYSSIAMLNLISSSSPSKMKLKRAGAESIAKSGMNNNEFSLNARKHYQELFNKL